LTFEAPLALALLALVPLAWWLHRNRRGAPVVKVASLLAFEGATVPPSAAPKRAIDVRIVLILVAMTLLALAAAGPVLSGARTDAMFVVVDHSASMTARTCDASKRWDEVLVQAAPDASPVMERLGDEGGADGLPERLVPWISKARADGFPGVVLVTDAELAPIPGVAVVGPSSGAKTNVAVAAAVLDGNEAIVSLRNYGRSDVVVKVRCADVTRDVALAAHGAGTARFAAPDRGEMATFEIVSPEDDLAADDRLVVRRAGGARRVRLREEIACPHLEAALRATGAEIVRGGAAADVVVDYRSGFPPSAKAGATPRLAVAPEGLRPSSVVRGDHVVGRGAFADVLPSPATTLVAGDRLDGGGVAWSDGAGTLVSDDAGLVVVALDPEDAGSDWHKDPSFPAFVAAALDRLTGGPDRLVAVDPVPASESDVVHDPPRTASPEGIRALLRRDPAAVHPARWLALAAAVLLAAAAFVRRS
jgi:hypothetical protein